MTQRVIGMANGLSKTQLMASTFDVDSARRRSATDWVEVDHHPLDIVIVHEGVVINLSRLGMRPSFAWVQNALVEAMPPRRAGSLRNMRLEWVSKSPHSCGKR